MVAEVVDVWVDMMNCSFFPEEYESLPHYKKDRLGDWVPFNDSLQDTSGVWLPLTVREIR